MSHTTLQRILFPIDKWKVDDMAVWLAEHKFDPLKITREGNYYHVRLTRPKKGARYSQKKKAKGLIFTFMF